MLTGVLTVHEIIDTTQNLLRITSTMSCQHFLPKCTFIYQCLKLSQFYCLKFHCLAFLHFFKTFIKVWDAFYFAIPVGGPNGTAHLCSSLF